MDITLKSVMSMMLCAKKYTNTWKEYEYPVDIAVNISFHKIPIKRTSKWSIVLKNNIT